MVKKHCDRCGEVQEENATDWVRLYTLQDNKPSVDMDCCPRCVRSFNKWKEPPPKAAPFNPNDPGGGVPRS